jgi:hypothetical protein
MKENFVKLFAFAFIFLAVVNLTGCGIKIGNDTDLDTGDYNIAVIATAGGSVDGGGSFDTDDQVTLTATPEFGYIFVNWTHAGAVYSELDTLTFTAEENLDLTANFALITQENVLSNTYYLHSANKQGEDEWYYNAFYEVFEFNSNGTYTLDTYEDNNYYSFVGTYVMTETTITLYLDSDITVSLVFNYFLNSEHDLTLQSTDEVQVETLVYKVDDAVSVVNNYEFVSVSFENTPGVYSDDYTETLNLNQDGTYAMLFHADGLDYMVDGNYEVVGDLIIVTFDDEPAIAYIYEYLFMDAQFVTFYHYEDTYKTCIYDIWESSM